MSKKLKPSNNVSPINKEHLELIEKLNNLAPFLDKGQFSGLEKLIIPAPKKLHTQPNFISTIPNAAMFYLDTYPDSPADYNITWSQIKNQIGLNFGFVTVGPTLGQYPTINAAYTAGHSNLLVIENITETISTTFSGILNIKVVSGISITFNSDINMVAAAGQDILNIFSEGVVQISYLFTADNILFDLSSIVASPPGFFKGTYIIQNNSDPSISAKPMVTNPSTQYAFELDLIIYITNGGLNSYFDMGIGLINNFILVCNPLNDCFGIKIRNNGIINSIFCTDSNNNTTLYDVTNTTVGDTQMIGSSGAPSAYLTNSICNAAIALGASAIKFTMAALNSGEVSILNNGRNVVVIPTGAYASKINNCLIAGLNLTMATGEVTKFTGCDFGSFVNINNALTYWNFSDCAFNLGLEITNSPGTNLTTCDFGQPGQAYGVQLDVPGPGIGAVNTIIIGGRTNTPIIDNGVNTQIIPTPNIF